MKMLKILYIKVIEMAKYKNMKKLRKNSKKTVIKITNAQLEAYERQYYERSNSEIIQWQQQMY
tara:strand:- start:370 stop:558 length:189 start_codon:yes stop_codon:yes gene_type:complete